MEWDEELKRRVPVTVTNKLKENNFDRVEMLNRTNFPSVTPQNQQSGDLIINAGFGKTGISTRNPYLKQRNKAICAENIRLRSNITSMRASPQLCTVK